MQESLEAMKTALRVLTALTEKLQPSPLDVDMLRQYAGPQPDGIGLDEYACDVIQRAIKRRAEVRRSKARPESLAG
jgi:hypothetical protein